MFSQTPALPYLKQMKQLASPESLCKVNILQDKPVSRLHAVLQHVPDLGHVTAVSHSESNSSYSAFHADLLAQLLQLVGGMLEQFSCVVTEHTFTLSVSAQPASFSTMLTMI